MIDSRDIKELHPKVQKLCNQFIEECKKSGIRVIITSTYRDNEAQTKLYNQGRISPGDVVTNAKAGESMHNYRVAFDFVPFYDNKTQYMDELLFLLLGNIGEKLGLEWGGDWATIKDSPHLQFTNGLTLKDFQAGKTID